jgi:hypothetical protein
MHWQRRGAPEASRELLDQGCLLARAPIEPPRQPNNDRIDGIARRSQIRQRAHYRSDRVFVRCAQASLQRSERTRENTGRIAYSQPDASKPEVNAENAHKEW